MTFPNFIRNAYKQKLVLENDTFVLVSQKQNLQDMDFHIC